LFSFYSKQEQQQQQPSLSRQQKSKGTGMTDNSSFNNLFTYKMGGDDETTESQNSKSSSNRSSTNNSIERHPNNNSSSNNGSSTDLKRYLKNFMLFSNLEIESEKKCRDAQLSKIVKALLLFEKKLRKEQEIIQQQLCEKDRVINRQMHTITNMKVKFGVDHSTSDDHHNDDDHSLVLMTNDTAEFCPMCRKKYYLRATKSTTTQTNSINGFSNNISDGELSNYFFSQLATSI
jgi:hypothetical protein